MHREMNIDLILNHDFNYENIYKIIRNIEKKGINFYNYIPDKRYFDSPKMGDEEAVIAILTKKYETSSLLCKYQDITFYLGFYKNEEKIKINLWGSGCSWQQEFLCGQKKIDYDVQRYIRFILELAYGLKITKIEAKIEWD